MVFLTTTFPVVLAKTTIVHGLTVFDTPIAGALFAILVHNYLHPNNLKGILATIL